MTDALPEAGPPLPENLPDWPLGFMQAKALQIKTQEGKYKVYCLSKFDAISGRELVAKYPVANMPKIGEYAVSEQCMFKLMTFVAALSPDGKIWYPLKSPELYRNHVPDWETGGQIEGAMWEYNCSFFGNGKASIFFGDIVQNFRKWILSTVMDSLRELSQESKQP